MHAHVHPLMCAVGVLMHMHPVHACTSAPSNMCMARALHACTQVGFLRPHLPFIFPERFLRHYPPEAVAPPANPHAPIDMPPIAWNGMSELSEFDDIKVMCMACSNMHPMHVCTCASS